MARRDRITEFAAEDARLLPAFADRDAAREAFFDRLMGWRARLASLLASAQGPPMEFSRDGLLALEHWAASFPAASCSELKTSHSELEFLIMWHTMGVAVRTIKHVEWKVSESDFVRGHWKFGIRQGLASFSFPLVPVRHESASRRRRKPMPWSEWLNTYLAHRSDPTLHPSVLANEHRLSAEHGLRSCQTLTLARGVDAFSESALLADLEAARGFHILETLRCFEHFSSLGDVTISRLCRLCDDHRSEAPHAIGLVLRHRPTTGLELAERHLEHMSEYSFGPIVDSIVSIPDIQATPVLKDAVRKISERKHPLWQAGETFSLAVGRLWHSARAGDAEAQAALKVVGRRWKRIPPETLEMLRRTAPRLTAELARSGGVRPKEK